MTCIVATSEGIWADRRVSDGEVRYRPSRKVVRGDGLVAAFCGDWARCIKAMAAVRAGETDLAALAAISEGIAVTCRGRFDLFAGAATRLPASVPIAVNGSGFAEAQAFLFGAKRFDPATIRAAFRYVASVRTDCGDGVDCLML